MAEAVDLAPLHDMLAKLPEKTTEVIPILQQAQASMKAAELPRLDETLAALATAAAGR